VSKVIHQREHWGSRLGFILAAAGSAIGLGSLWKFPYVTGNNGGGAFVLVYLLTTIFVAFPLFIAELTLGRASQKGPVKAFENLSHKSRSWAGVGWLALLSTLIVYSYYAVVAGWTLNYLLLSLTQSFQGKSAEEISGIFNAMATSGDVNVLWQLAFILLTLGVVWGGVREGIEHWARILTPALLLLLVGLFIYSMTLPGAGEAIRFVLYPDFSKLSASAVLQAMGLSFFTASLGFGIIITYGSYMQKGENIPSTSAIVLGLTVTISLMAALMIFPIIFSFGMEPEAGPGLVFKTLPVLFARLPGSLLISVAFFSLLIFTALTSTVSLLENMVANMMELFAFPRRRAVLVASLLVFVVGLPSALAASGSLFPDWKLLYGENFFDTLGTLWDRWFLPIVGLLTALFVGWVIDRKVRDDEFLQGSHSRSLLKIWLFLIRWFVPAAIFLFILEGAGLINLEKALT
jgi:neurotransmitter:Na+ symporter, NSS family